MNGIGNTVSEARNVSQTFASAIGFYRQDASSAGFTVSLRKLISV
jgi:hypothetical protein